jgi:selenide,water dikinase
MAESSEVLLTEFSHGAGCGCKIAPAVLDTILKSNIAPVSSPNLLVGNDKKDDAAVYDIGNGKAVISTTDFFMPIVDDAFDFGRIASVNAISDVYAMGGKPLLAIAILGWPVNKVPIELAGKVLEGARAVCKEAGIALAGGHSIDNPEPLFGLAVTGEVAINNLKQNSTATEGCELFITKPIGVGILTTAKKKKLVDPDDLQRAVDNMLTLNKAGEVFGQLDYVKAMTDVTGFGLLGHLGEMVDGSNLSAEIDFAKIPVMEGLDGYIAQNCIPGGTNRNWTSYGEGIVGVDEKRKAILADPQTSGGLLVAVERKHVAEFLLRSEKMGLKLESFGSLVRRSTARITVR